MKNLSLRLIEVGNKISSTTEVDKSYLTLLKTIRYDYLKPYVLKDYEEKVRFLSFFLMNFLDDVFYNLAGDFPSEKSFGAQVHKIRKDFFKNFGIKLTEIGQAVAKNDHSLVHDYLVALIVDYLEKINEINRTIEEHRKY